MAQPRFAGADLADHRSRRWINAAVANSAVGSARNPPRRRACIDLGKRCSICGCCASRPRTRGHHACSSRLDPASAPQRSGEHRVHDRPLQQGHDRASSKPERQPTVAISAVRTGAFLRGRGIVEHWRPGVKRSLRVHRGSCCRRRSAQAHAIGARNQLADEGRRLVRQTRVSWSPSTDNFRDRCHRAADAPVHPSTRPPMVGHCGALQAPPSTHPPAAGVAGRRRGPGHFAPPRARAPRRPRGGCPAPGPGQDRANTPTRRTPTTRPSRRAACGGAGRREQD